MDLPLIIEIINEGPGVPREGPEPKPEDPIGMHLLQLPRFKDGYEPLLLDQGRLVKADFIVGFVAGDLAVPVEDVDRRCLVDSAEGLRLYAVISILLVAFFALLVRNPKS